MKTTWWPCWIKRLLLQLYLRNWLWLFWAPIACQTSLFSFLWKHCLFYHLIPFWQWGKFSLWAPGKLRAGFWKRDDVSMFAVTPVNSNLALVAVNQVQGKRVISSFLFSALSHVAVPGHCQRQGAGLEGFLVWTGMAIPISFYGHIQSSKRCSETWLFFAEAVLIKVSHIMIFQVFYYSLLNSCFDHLQCADVMLTGLNIG